MPQQPTVSHHAPQSPVDSDADTKRCARCGHTKPHEAFYRRRSGGLSGYCRACQQANARESYRRRRQDPDQLARMRAVDAARKRRSRSLAARGGERR